MAREDQTRKLESELIEAAIDGRWDALASVREELDREFIRATKKADRATLARIEAQLLEAHRIIVIRHKVSRDAPDARHAWGLLAQAQSASLALREIPKNVILTHQELSVSELVLTTLLAARGDRMTNTEISDKTGVPAATICRVMDRLRADSLVSSTRVGRYKKNKLTERGIAKARILLGQTRDPEPVKDPTAAVKVIEFTSSALQMRLKRNSEKIRSEGSGHEAPLSDMMAALRKE